MVKLEFEGVTQGDVEVAASQQIVLLVNTVILCLYRGEVVYIAQTGGNRAGPAGMPTSTPATIPGINPVTFTLSGLVFSPSFFLSGGTHGNTESPGNRPNPSG